MNVCRHRRIKLGRARAHYAQDTAWGEGEGTDQTKLTLTGNRRESFVFNRVVMPGKEGVKVIISVRAV